MKAHVLLFAILGAFLFSSCQHFRIDKRRYSSGYYISTGTDKREASAAPEKTPVAKEETVSSEPAAPAQSVAAVQAPAQSAPVNENNTNSDPVVNAVPAPAEETITEPVAPVVTENNAPVQADSPAESAPNESDVALILLVILAILLPPIAVLLYEGITNRFWITLILCILGGGFFFSPYIGLLWLIAIIIALMVVLGAI